MRWLASVSFLTLALSSSALAWWHPGPRPAPRPTAPPAPVLGTYVYTTRVPSQGETCAIAAETLATRLQQYDAEVLDAQGRCVARASFEEKGVTYSVDTLEVTYRAILPVRLALAQLPTPDMSNYPTVYPTYASCMGDLAAQTELFSRGMGVPVLTASCNSSGSEYTGYLLKIDGVGKTDKYLHTFKNGSYRSITEDAGWRQTVLDGIVRTGGVVARINDQTIAYYADQNAMFSTRSWFNTRTLQQCEVQLDEARAMHQRMGAKEATVACHSDRLFGFVMDSAGNIPSFMYSPGTYRFETYNSFEECMAIRADALVRDPSAGRWLGSFCAPRQSDPSHFEILVYRPY